MTYEPFDNDKAWVRYKCLELAKDTVRYGNPEKMIEAARQFSSFILATPKCKIVKMRRRK